MFDYDNLSKYSLKQIKDQIDLLLAKQSKYKKIIILLSILCLSSLIATIVLMVLFFTNFNLTINNILMPFSIVLFIVFLISFGIDTFYLLVLYPTLKNQIIQINAFLNEK